MLQGTRFVLLVHIPRLTPSCGPSFASRKRGRNGMARKNCEKFSRNMTRFRKSKGCLFPAAAVRAKKLNPKQLKRDTSQICSSKKE